MKKVNESGLEIKLLSSLIVSTGAAASQEQLALAAQNAVSTIVTLAEVVKFGAASLGSNNPEAQVCWSWSSNLLTNL